MPWAPDYVTFEELREYVRIRPDADDLDDTQIQDAATGASRAIDGECLRQFGQASGVEARTYTPVWSKTRGGWLVPIDDVMSSAGMLVHVDAAHDGTYSTLLEATEYVLRPRNAPAIGRPWEAVLIKLPARFRMTGAEGEVRVTANPFGWDTVPRTVKLASKLQGARFLSRRDSPYGVAGSPEQGNELRLLAKVDADVAVMLKTYRRRVRAR